MPMTRKRGLLVPATVPFWLKPGSTFGLFSVTMFIERSPGFGALCSPGALAVHDRVMARPGTRSSALLAQASQHLWLAFCYDVYREFTSVHHTIHPAPSPPDAGRDTVPSRFGCQSGDCGYRVRGLCTGRYLPAHPRRILLMEQQVWSILHARRSTLRARVAVPSQKGDASRLGVF